MKSLLVIALALIIPQAQAAYTYDGASALFSSLPEAKVAEALGSWKMVAYGYSKTKEVHIQPGGLKLGGASVYAEDFRKVYDITYRSIPMHGISMPLTTFKVTNTVDAGPDVRVFSFLTGLSGQLPEPEMAKYSRIHCKAIKGALNTTSALLCQQRGMSSGSVYVSCFLPKNSNGLGACAMNPVIVRPLEPKVLLKKKVFLRR